MTGSRRFHLFHIMSMSLVLATASACLSVGDRYFDLSEGYIEDPGKSTKPSDVSDLSKPDSEAITRAVEEGWMATYLDGTFRAEGSVTREGFASILNRSLLEGAKAPPINGDQTRKASPPDVERDRWSNPAIKSLLDWNIIQSNQNFFPDINITREEAISWLFTALQKLKLNLNPDNTKTNKNVAASRGRLFLDATEQLRLIIANVTKDCPSFDLADNHPALFSGHKILTRKQAAVWAAQAHGCVDQMQRLKAQAPEPDAQGPDSESRLAFTGEYQTACDIVVNGGTLAGTAAALAAAQSGKVTCLIEPLSYPAGFWLSAAEPIPIPRTDAKDRKTLPTQVAGTGRFAEINEILNTTDTVASQTPNREPAYLTWLRKAGAVTCAAEYLCFNPLKVLEYGLYPQIESQPNLFVFAQAQIVGVQFKRSLITGLSLRQSVSNASSSKPAPHDFISIQINRGTGARERHENIGQIQEENSENSSAPFPLVVIEASPHGDVLVNSQSGWLQGLETPGSVEPGADQCGHAFGFTAFANIPSAILQPKKAYKPNGNGTPQELTKPQPLSLRSGIFNGKEWSPEDIQSALKTWPVNEANQEAKERTEHTSAERAYFFHEKGNVYSRQSYLASREEAIAQSKSKFGWQGGLNQRAISHARETLDSWMRFLSAATRQTIRPEKGYFSLTEALAPLPRITTGRRGIGYQGFLITSAEPSPDVLAWAIPRQTFQGLQTCSYPPAIRDGKLPTSIPITLRSLLSDSHPNLIFSGPAIASNFIYNHLLSSADAHWKSGLLAGSLAITLLNTSGHALAIEYTPRPFITQSIELWRPLLQPVQK